MTDEIDRREFVKRTIAGTAALTSASAGLDAAQDGAAGAPDRRKPVVAALGSVFVPSSPGDPGYADLESHGITDYVLQGLQTTEGLVSDFNTAARQFFGGKTFLELDDLQREKYLGLIAEGNGIADAAQRKKLQDVYRTLRRRILTVYYSNYPEHKVKRDAQGVPLLRPGDTHQQLNPNTTRLVTGWDIAGYKGPADWKEEEEIRSTAKKTLPYWLEGDLVRLNSGRPSAAAAVKTSQGHDYYDVIVVGGGGTGCIVAGRLAERGINPKTGDRLRVAMIEGGDDWTVRDPGIKPGYGYPIRRRMITEIPDGVGIDGGYFRGGPAYRYPDRGPGGPVGYNFRIVGGCSLHYGTLWVPGDEDFHFYRQASGVDWDLAKFGDAIQEIRDLFHVSTLPDTTWARGEHIWADAGRALGLEMRTPELAYLNYLGLGGSLNRYDTKGTSLPWAYIGLNNGLKIIPNAEVEKILIDKPSGGRPVATGAVYKDKAGAFHEVRAARVIVACNPFWTPLLLYKSGYGPRDLLGDKLVVENKNVGANLSGDESFAADAFLAEPVLPEGRDGQRRGPEPWAAATPRPWGDLTVQIRSSRLARNPDSVALGSFAPAFGREHKEYMRNEAGVRRILSWRAHIGAIPATWRVLPPDGRMELVEMDVPRVEAAIRGARELVEAWIEKLSVKAIKTDLEEFHHPAKEINPHHASGTARAGASRDASVCSSDFDCHDIDHLLITSAAVIPKCFVWSMGPAAVIAAYGWRRMVANHFSTGCSTKGFS